MNEGNESIIMGDTPAVNDADQGDLDGLSHNEDGGYDDDLDDLHDDNELDGGVISDDYDSLDEDEEDIDEIDEIEDIDDEDDDDDEELDDDEDDFDEYEDATVDEIDFVVALYREDGVPIFVPLAANLANDLDELIAALRRLPGDAGALGVLSIEGEFFVLCRVRGRTVQVLLSDVLAANDWPIARDVIDYLGIEEPDPDGDSEPIGDFGMLADQGVSELDLERIAGDLDDESDVLVVQIMDLMKLGKLFDRAVR